MTDGLKWRAGVGPSASASESQVVSWIEVDRGDTVWRFDASFFRSNWTCIWGRGCHGIGTEKAADLALGCCEVGADLDGVEESMLISATAAALRPELFQHHADAQSGGVFADEERLRTRVVDGACIFLNRPGFAGGEGCALHIAALSVDESPIDWKPSVCWQLPIHVDWEMRGDIEVATVRGWRREDWGDDGDTMAWCCSEPGDGGEAFIGVAPVVDSLRAEIEAIVGEDVYAELRVRLRISPTR